MTDRGPISADATHGGRPSHRRATASPVLDSVVCFAIAGKAYALDVGVVREVVTVDHWIAVPHAPAAIMGAFALRGATVALVDTRIVFGLDPAGPPSTALVVASGHRTICALTIDRVIGVAPFVAAQFTPAVAGREPAQVAGFLASEASGLVTVIDAATLVHALERLRF
jgi:purine-binding chemotaxis protein CheW